MWTWSTIDHSLEYGQYSCIFILSYNWENQNLCITITTNYWVLMVYWILCKNTVLTLHIQISLQKYFFRDGTMESHIFVMPYWEWFCKNHDFVKNSAPMDAAFSFLHANWPLCPVKSSLPQCLPNRDTWVGRHPLGSLLYNKQMNQVSHCIVLFGFCFFKFLITYLHLTSQLSNSLFDLANKESVLLNSV